MKNVWKTAPLGAEAAARRTPRSRLSLGVRITRAIAGVALSVLPAALVCAQVSAPKIGIARYNDSTVHAIYGLPFNLIQGEEVLSNADAVSFSDFGGLVSVHGQIQLLDRNRTVVGRYDSTESAPVLNIDGDLTSAIAWLPSENKLLHWNGKSFDATETSSSLFPGKVTSVRLENKCAKLFVAESNGAVAEVTVPLETGNPTNVTILPGIEGWAFEEHGYVLFQDERGLELESANGQRQTFEIPVHDLTIERMSSDWLHIASPSTNANWALHISGSVVQLSALPTSGVSPTRL